MADRKRSTAATPTGAPLPVDAARGAAQPQRGRPIGAEDLKAFTHPLRMAMYGMLRDHGPATATQLARLLGESSGQTSYHLRQLERHGFVEDDPEHTGGRERWWRPVGFSLEPETLLDDPASVLAARAMVEQDIAERARVLRRWAESVFTGEIATGEDDQVLDSRTARLTPAEAGELIHAVQSVMEEHVGRADARRAEGDTAGVRRTRIYFDVLPLTFPAGTDG